MKLISKEEHTLELKDKKKYEFRRLYSNGLTVTLKRTITYIDGEIPHLFDWKSNIDLEEKYYVNNVEIDEELYEYLSSNLPDWIGDGEDDYEDDETDE